MDRSEQSSEALLPRGVALLHDPTLNKGMAFTLEERRLLGLQGLLPPQVQDQAVQVTRVMENLRRKTSDLERYIFLIALQDRNETLFHRVVMEHLEELMPIIYTPTVGEACQLYGHIFRRPRGLFVSLHDRGRVAEVLRNWPLTDVRVVVVTDGERILGLGDLGAAGMGIPVGKLALYTACAGIHPAHCLPVTLDVGTNNEALLSDPLYIGLPQRRERGEAYDALVEEFLSAVETVYPGAIVQLEDFANHNAFRLLEEYRNRVCLFDDDIQGTGGVVLAGIYSAARLTGIPLTDQRFVFLGAGEAGVGIAGLFVQAMVEEGLSVEEARRRCWFVDSKGLVVKSRTDLAPHKLTFAHEAEFVSEPLDVVRAIRPTGLIGVSGVPGLISRPVLEAMVDINQRPLVFALSNPTSKAECTAEEAYAVGEGCVVFASGSPFAPVTVNGRTHVPGQANNAYIFPGVGLGLLAAGSRCATDGMFIAAARSLAGQVTDEDLALGRVFPSLERIRDVSAHIAVAVAKDVYEEGCNRKTRPDDLLEHVRSLMYEPAYQTYI